MTPYYVDANPLVDWLQGRVLTLPPGKDLVPERIDNLILDDEAHLFTSEVGIVEVLDQIAKGANDTNIPALSMEWAQKARLDLMRLVRDRRIEVIPSDPRTIRRGIGYVWMAAREHRIALRNWDAVHLATAVERARSTGERVILVTSDGDFERTVRFYPAFTAYVTILDLRSK